MPSFSVLKREMSKTDMALIKPEMMKSYIWLQTADGSIQQIEQEIAMLCPIICQRIVQKGMGSSKNYPISLPQPVNPAMLSLILDYCRFHQVPGHSDKECKSFDEKFVRMDLTRLCELSSAANSLQLKPLVDITCCALARMIEGKTPEEIRDIFKLPDDLTEEEKLEPFKNIRDDPRIRLLNRLFARKRKELIERNKLKNVVTEEECADDRSVDDLLSFINGGSEDSKVIKASKNKKKNQRKKHRQKNLVANDAVKSQKDSNGVNFVSHGAEADNNFQLNTNETSKFHTVEYDSSASTPKDEFDSDDIDHERMKNIDREVEEFAQRINSVWSRTKQKRLSLR